MLSEKKTTLPQSLEAVAWWFCLSLRNCHPADANERRLRRQCEISIVCDDGSFSSPKECASALSFRLPEECCFSSLCSDEGSLFYNYCKYFADPHLFATEPRKHFRRKEIGQLILAVRFSFLTPLYIKLPLHQNQIHRTPNPPHHQSVHHRSRLPSRQSRLQAFSCHSCGAQVPLF